jgi:hypothetical protein
MACTSQKTNACGILVRKSEGKCFFEGTTHRWVFNIKMDLEKIGLVTVNKIDLAQDRDTW